MDRVTTSTARNPNKTLTETEVSDAKLKLSSVLKVGIMILKPCLYCFFTVVVIDGEGMEVGWGG